MTQAELARAIGVSRSAINQLETGTSKSLKASTIVALEKVSGYNGHWIESGRGKEKKQLTPYEKGAEEQIEKIYRELMKLPREHRDKIEAEIDFLVSLNDKPKS